MISSCSLKGQLHKTHAVPNKCQDMFFAEMWTDGPKGQPTTHALFKESHSGHSANDRLIYLPTCAYGHNHKI